MRKVYYGVVRWFDGLSVALTGEPPSQFNKYTWKIGHVFCSYAPIAADLHRLHNFFLRAAYDRVAFVSLARYSFRQSVNIWFHVSNAQCNCDHKYFFLFYCRMELSNMEAGRGSVRSSQG